MRTHHITIAAGLLSGILAYTADAQAIDYITPAPVGLLATGDFDADGLDDVVFTDANCTWVRHASSATQPQLQCIAEPATQAAVLYADGDEAADLVLEAPLLGWVIIWYGTPIEVSDPVITGPGSLPVPVSTPNLTFRHNSPPASLPDWFVEVASPNGAITYWSVRLSHEDAGINCGTGTCTVNPPSGTLPVGLLKWRVAVVGSGWTPWWAFETE